MESQAMVDVLQHKLVQMRSQSVLSMSGLKAWSAASRRTAKCHSGKKKLKEIDVSPLARRRGSKEAPADTSLPSKPTESNKDPSASQRAAGARHFEVALAVAAVGGSSESATSDTAQDADRAEHPTEASPPQEAGSPSDSDEAQESMQQDSDAGLSTPPAEIDDLKETDEVGRPLLDLSALEGIPLESIKMLLSMYFTPGSKIDAHAQLASIRATVASGEVDESQLRKSLHQLAGSSLQAGAFAFGTRVKEYKLSRDGVAGVDALQELLTRTGEAARRKGFL